MAWALRLVPEQTLSELLVELPRLTLLKDPKNLLESSESLRHVRHDGQCWRLSFQEGCPTQCTTEIRVRQQGAKYCQCLCPRAFNDPSKFRGCETFGVDSQFAGGSHCAHHRHDNVGQRKIAPSPQSSPQMRTEIQNRPSLGQILLQHSLTQFAGNRRSSRGARGEIWWLISPSCWMNVS